MARFKVQFKDDSAIYEVDEFSTREDLINSLPDVSYCSEALEEPEEEFTVKRAWFVLVK